MIKSLHIFKNITCFANKILFYIKYDILSNCLKKKDKMFLINKTSIISIKLSIRLFDM